MVNLTLFYIIHDLSRHYPLLDQIMIFGAQTVILLTSLTLIILAVVNKFKGRSIVLLSMLGLSFTLIIVRIIHLFYFEPRPFLALAITPLIDQATDASFPSFHTSLMTIMTIALIFNKSKLVPLYILLTVWVGLARIYVGVHYPIDILGGIVVGWLAVQLAWWIKVWVTRKLFTV